MRSKIRKVTWLVWVLLMLPVAESMAATFGGNEGGVKWSYDTETHCLTISPRGTSGTVNRKEYANGVTADYGGVWNYGNSGTPAWRTTQTQGRTSYNLQNLVRCVTVEEGVTRIGAAAFYNFPNLETVTLPSTLVSIGVEAFRKTSITQLNLPENVQYIGDRWITDCFDLELITVDPNNTYFKVDQIYGALFTYDMQTLVRFPIKRCVKEVRIPEGVKKMATDAMYQLDCVEEIILPSTLDTIQYAVFDWCNNLKTIRFSSEFPPVFSDGYNLNPGDDWNYSQLTSEGKANRNNMMIYMPCIPDSTFDERTGEYERVTQIDAKRISGWLADFVIVATPVEETVSGTPVSTDRGIAWVETKRTCDNDTTKIIAEAREGSRFIQWRQGSNGFITKENPYVFTAGVSDTFYAYFAKGEYGVTALVNDTSLGLTTGSGIYASETEVTLTATAKSCGKFVRWSDGVTTAERTLTVGVKDTTVTAIFNRLTNKVTASANQYGSVSIYDLNGNVITSGSNVACGDSIVFVATPNEYCSFVNWNNDGSLIKDKDTIIVTDDITRRGIFVQDSFLVTFYNVGNVELCKDKYVYGVTPSCTEPENIVTAEYTYTFKGWNPAVTPVRGEATYYAVYDTIANPYDLITVVENNQTRKKYKFGESVATPANPTVKEGYVFKGWFDAPANGAEVSFPFNMPAKDTTAYAVLVPDTFILTYKTFDSLSVISRERIAFGDDVTMPTTGPAREGYTFKGWSSSFTTMPARDTFVAAVYTINSYKLTLKDIDGATLSEKTVEYGTQIDEPDFDKEGYTCNGWKNGESVANFPFNMPAQNVTLVANCKINQYTLVFKSDDTTIVGKIIDDYKAAITANEIPTASKTGYTFQGWDHEVPSIMPASDDTFFAQWTINKYNVKFKKNDDEVISSKDYDFGSKFDVPANPDSLGYTFLEWAPSLGDSIVPAKDLTFIAQWTINQHTVTFKKNVDEIISSKEYNFGEMFETPADPDSVGHTFEGWEPTVTSNKVPDEDLTFIAQWSINSYKYIVVKNNGEKNDTTVYDYNAEIKLPSTPEKEGYTFKGWSDSTTVMPAKNVVTEAQWSINQYNVTFMMNEKEVLSSQDYDFGSTFEVPADPDSIGHKFLGWNPEIVSTVVPAESLVFVAQWSRNSYNYTIVKNNGEEDETTSYFYGEEFTLPSTPKKEGNTFLGWSDSTTVMPAKNVVTEAQWEVNKYTMTFMSGNEATDTVISKQQVLFGNKITFVQTPKKEGYSFDGWVNAEEGDSMRTIMPAKNLTYYATFKINSYVITFVDGNHDTIEVDGHRYCDTLEFGSKFLVPAFESIEAWNEQAFEGWTPAIESDTTVPARNITYSALYDGDKYPVYFIDGLTENTIETIYYNSSSVVPEYTNIPEHEGYKFKEWHRTSYWGDAVKFPFTMVGQEESFYAYYDPIYYKVAILDGVTGDTIAKDTLPYGNELCEGRGGRDYCIYPESFEKEGYTFLGLSDTVLTVPAHNLTIIALYGINSYDVTYVNTYTGEKDTVSYKYGDIVKALEYEPSECVDYTVWINEEGDTIQFGFAMPAHDTVAYLDFDIKSFTLTFKDYNDTVLFSNVLEGESILIENERERWQSKYKSDNDPEIDLVPHREGYRFIGWTSEEDGVTTPAMVDTLFRGKEMPCHDLEYIANYVIDTFNVYLVKEFNEGKPLYYDTIPYVFNAEVTEPAHDSITGYHYNGWYSYPSYENVTFSFVMPAHDTVICLYQYSPNQHELTFKDYNDTTLRSTTVEYGTPVATADSISYAALVPVPSREGYTFTGWNDEVPATMPDKDVVLTAQYSINSYPITFYFDKDSILYTDTIEYQSAISIPTVEREGYDFTGWDATIPGKMPADTLEFYAQFEAIPYTLTFVDFDKSEISKAEYTFGDNVSYPKEEPTRVGYTFIGWKDSLETMPAKNVTVTAQYRINQHTVTFYDDNKVEIATISGDYGKVVTEPDAPEHEGYSFIGWDKEVPATIPDSDVVLNAQYAINDYYVFFLDYNGDTLQIDTVPFGSDNIAYPADPKREGYDFVGYIEKVPTTMPAHDIIAKAQYVLLQYSVKFYDSFDNKLISDFHENYGTPVVVPTVPKHEGYTFTGWSDTVPATVPAKNVKLTAQYAINEYVLTFKFKDSTIQKENVEYGADVVRPTFVPEVGYHFVEWSDKDTIQKMPAKNVTITAKVDADLHTITFRDYDSTLIRQVTSKYGSVLSTEDIIPSLKGYTFDKWSIDIPATMPAYDTVAYAEYVPNQYTITYKDYDQSVVRVDTFFYKDTIKAIEGPEREGYTFKGWKTIPTTMPIGGVEVTAQYKVNSYIISFRSMDSTKIETKNREFGSELVAPEIPELEGYTTLGWDKEVPATVPAKNDTFYAQYQINKYSLSFEDKEDGTIYQSDSLNYNSVVTLPADPTKEGYTFAGWDMDVPTNMPALNIVTYAVWKANPYVLSFVDYNDSILDIDTLDFGAKVVYPADPVREGYNFVGWADSLLTMPAYNDSIIAQYQVKKYEVIFKDGDSIIFKDSLAYGDTIIAPADPEKKGYQFDGWNPEVPVTVPAYDIILTPTWTKAEFVITFLDYDSTVVAQDTLMFNANIVKPKVTREGYTFTGWNPEVPNKMPGADLTTIAEYSINKHEIIFVDADDNIIFKDSLYYGDSIVIPADPTKDGYDFAGWDPEVPATVPDEDLYITPVFTKAEFIITFLDFDSTEIFKDTLSYDSKIAVIKDPTREGYTFTGWNPVVPNKMPGENFTTIAEYTINSHIVTLLDDDDNILFRDTFVYGDSIKVDTVPSKDGFTFDGWNPVIPELAPDSDLTAHPTWVEDALVLDSVDAFADNFCAGDVARVYYSVSSGKPTSFTITFDAATTDAGFKTQTGVIGEDGEIFMTIPDGVEEGVYTATLQLTGVDSTSNAVDFKFATNLSSRYISRMWDDVVVCDNSDEEFESYQWYKNGEKIKGATKQFYCELGGLDGFYSVIVKTKDGKKKHICGIQCDYVLPPFSLIAYPNPAKANEQFTLEVKGLTEEELKDAKISVFSVSGRVALTDSDVEYKNLVSLPHGEYIALVTFEGKSAFCKILVR